jgi:hypothetical protein
VEGNRPWPNLRYYHSIYLERFRKTTIKPQSVEPVLGRDLNPRPSEYEARVLTTRPRRSVLMGGGGEKEQLIITKFSGNVRSSF